MPPNKHMRPAAAAVVAPGKGTEEHEDEERRVEERGDVSIRGMEAGREGRMGSLGMATTWSLTRR